MEYIINDLADINELSFSAGVPTKISYNSGDFEYNILIYYKERFNNLVVLSNGAVNYEKKAPPIFMRSKWARDIEGSLIYLDDATIHNTSLSLGWGQGNKNEFVLRIYSEMVKMLAKKMNVVDENVCYFGSSAGGFMSMLLASMHKDSFSIVNNPQTDIKNYHVGHSKPLLELSYGSIENAYDNYAERVNVSNAFIAAEFVPKIFYIQNHFSHHDLKFHLNPFIKDLKEKNLNIDNISLITYFDKEKGHTPLDKEPGLNSLNLLLKHNIF